MESGTPLDGTLHSRLKKLTKIIIDDILKTTNIYHIQILKYILQII